MANSWAGRLVVSGWIGTFLAACCICCGEARGDEPRKDPPAPAQPQPAAGKDAPTTPETKGGKPAFAVLLKDATRLGGLIPLHRKDDKVYAELPESVMGKDLFVLISIARGIGERSVLGGMSW